MDVLCLCGASYYWPWPSPLAMRSKSNNRILTAWSASCRILPDTICWPDYLSHTCSIFQVLGLLIRFWVLFLGFVEKTLLSGFLEAKPCRTIMELPQHVSFGPEPCEIEAKVGTWKCPACSKSSKRERNPPEKHPSFFKDNIIRFWSPEAIGDWINLETHKGQNIWDISRWNTLGLETTFWHCAWFCVEEPTNV